ncbi:ArsJ-associated glyceraldehyde-3-phosphate dehydrogenase [Paracoccus sp. S-4012]|uniref:ArsJ-associated glyceraldehyde-3-phosphate dehydrogenase n=1 Tax=Paracoccus sp. S-4012 TaxID=2665648 RepID=UPI00132868CD|nr:ArsJ-associated glyceraldehyde-3-phosphate dehydrogenase [Paracoccus sp. S-4012]
MSRIAINGLGRMGKLLVRRMVDEGMAQQIALLNDPVGSAEDHALWLSFDSVHGRWRDVAAEGNALNLDGARVPLSQASRIEDLDLSGVDIVVDCTGVFKTPAKCAPYFAAGVRKVIVSAPIKDEAALNIVYGVNHDLFDPAQHDLITAASCTTNCLAPVVKVLHEQIGISHGSITTIHDVTNTQTIVDRPARDLRRARSALANLIPTTTGSATAITLIYPELKGRLNGHAVRVPLLNASLTDCVFEMSRPVSVDEVNGLFAAAAEGLLRGVLGYEDRPLVSTDYLNDPRSAIVDGLSTMVVNGTQLKVYAWYDNEWGYVCRLLDVTRMVAGQL